MTPSRRKPSPLVLKNLDAEDIVFDDDDMEGRREAATVTVVGDGVVEKFALVMGLRCCSPRSSNTKLYGSDLG